MRRTTICSAAEAVAEIRDGHTVAIQGSGGGVSEPSTVIKAIGERFCATGQPRGLTLVHATGLGDRDTLGADALAHPGLVGCDIAGHLGMANRMGKLIVENRLQCYNLPQGVISHLFGAIASRKPGVITKVGLHTFVDPRLEGGRVNTVTTRDYVQVITLGGEEWLFYPSFPIDIAIVRGTTADERGNISMENEAAILEALSIAQAARASGGLVIAQVKYLTTNGSIDPRIVKIPGMYVDRLVVDPAQKQHTLAEYDPSLSGERPVPLDRLEPAEPGMKRIIGMRACRELAPDAVVNLGVGVPSYVAAVAAETGLIDRITFTVEQGIVGGRPAGGIIFGVSHNPEAIIGEDSQFNFYDGGTLDTAFLGMAETDERGDVNVSKVGSLLAGCGGFINISQGAKSVVFCGTFTAKGLEIEARCGRLRIVSEGSLKKFVTRVAQVTFSAAFATRRGQKVLYVTERAVFALVEGRLQMVEVAPGIDVGRDVLAHMDFRPLIADPLPTMDAELFGG
jgi:propionate CoA-transferase